MDEGRRDPQAGSVESSSGFRRWKKRRRKSYLQCALMILVLEVLVSVMVFSDPVSELRRQDLIFGILGLIGFALLAVYCLYQWVRFFFVRVRRVRQGTVLEKSRYSRGTLVKQKRNRNYYVTARSGGETLEALCLFDVYHDLAPGDRVVLFTIGTEQWHAIIP